MLTKAGFLTGWRGCGNAQLMGWFPSIPAGSPRLDPQHCLKPGTVTCSCNPSTWEAKAGGLQSNLHSMRSCLKKQSRGSPRQNIGSGWAEERTPIITSALERWRQKNREFKVILQLLGSLKASSFYVMSFVTLSQTLGWGGGWRELQSTFQCLGGQQLRKEKKKWGAFRAIKGRNIHVWGRIWVLGRVWYHIFSFLLWSFEAITHLGKTILSWYGKGVTISMQMKYNELGGVRQPS